MTAVYEQTVVLGTGSLALNCALSLKKAGMECRLFDMNEKLSKSLRRQAHYYEVDYFFGKPRRVAEEILAIPGRVLLISAINSWILPGSLLNREGLKAINCHQALLPKHPGRNAEMWAVYEGDRQTGITWHEMSEQVDAGKILIQKSFPLTGEDTAWSVFRRQMVAAYEGFQEILEPLLEGKAVGIPQNSRERGRLRYSWEIPENGILDPGWNGKQISAFLRAVDYAGLSVLTRRPAVHFEGENWFWKKYRISGGGLAKERIRMEKSTLVIEKDGYFITLYDCVKEDEENGTADEIIERITAGG